MSELKIKFEQSTSYPERVQILTLSPFTIKRTMQEFGATNYMVKNSRVVMIEKGILGLPDRGKGKSLSEELKTNVLQFYEENDDYSRLCPGERLCSNRVCVTQCMWAHRCEGQDEPCVGKRWGPFWNPCMRARYAHCIAFLHSGRLFGSIHHCIPTAPLVSASLHTYPRTALLF